MIDLKTELKVTKALSNIMGSVSDPMVIMPESEVIAMDPANVCMFIAKTTLAKRLLMRFVEREDDVKTMPNLDYHFSGIPSSKYSIEYLKQIMDFFSLFDESLKLTMKEDYPITIENTDFIVILAPRVTDDN